MGKIKTLLRDTFIYNIAKNFVDGRTFRDWKKKGMPVPPPHIVKINTVKEYAKRFSIKTLVETGTYYGAMVAATKNTFTKIYSIELSKDLYYTRTCEGLIKPLIMCAWESRDAEGILPLRTVISVTDLWAARNYDRCVDCYEKMPTKKDRRSA